VLLRGPNARPEHVAQRACVLAERINAPAACAPAQRLAANLDRQHTGPRWELAPHAGPLHAPAGRRAACQHPGRGCAAPLGRKRRIGSGEAAAVVVDNASGEVMAYVGRTGRRAGPGRCCAAPATCWLPFAYGWRWSAVS
jgi:penicillin-binding protein 1C